MSPSATKTASSPRSASADWKWRTSIRARELGVADHDPGDEDGEEARAVRRPPRGRRRPRRRASPPAGRASRRAAARGAAPAAARRRRRRRPRARCPSRAGTPRRRRRRRPTGARRELDHPDHQRDPDRVVEPRLALEDRARAALDLLAGEDGERHRRVGRRERCADQERRRSSRSRAGSAPRRRRAGRSRRSRGRRGS